MFEHICSLQKHSLPKSKDPKQSQPLKQKTTLSDDTVRLSEHFSPTILEGESCFFESFHAVPKISELPLSAVRELPELWGQWEGKVAQGWSQSQRQARGQSIMKHTNTQLCVDSLPLFLPIHHNRPLIPLRSAHQGQTVPIQWRCRIWWNQTAE